MTTININGWIWPKYNPRIHFIGLETGCKHVLLNRYYSVIFIQFYYLVSLQARKIYSIIFLNFSRQIIWFKSFDFLLKILLLWFVFGRIKPWCLGESFSDKIFLNKKSIYLLFEKFGKNSEIQKRIISLDAVLI